MGRWKEIALEALEQLSEDNEALVPLKEGAEGQVTVDLETLEAGEGVITQKTLRQYFWEFRKELEGCNALMVRQDHDRWFIVAGTAEEVSNG